MIGGSGDSVYVCFACVWGMGGGWCTIDNWGRAEVAVDLQAGSGVCDSARLAAVNAADTRVSPHLWQPHSEQMLHRQTSQCRSRPNSKTPR